MNKLIIRRENRGGFTAATQEINLGRPLAITPVFSFSDSDYVANKLGVDADIFYNALRRAEEYGVAEIESEFNHRELHQNMNNLFNESKERKIKTITIQEETKIPQEDGSVIILEEGDKIQIQENVLPASIERDLEDWSDNFSNPFDAGLNLGSAILKFVEESNEEFIEGFFKAIRKVL